MMFVIAAVLYVVVAYYILEGLWAFGLWKLNRNIRRREEREKASVHEEVLHDAG